MSQCARVALWIPTVNPPDASGDIVRSTGASGAQKVIPSQFAAAGSGGGGGIPEAPTDGTIYGRQNAAWTAVPTGGGGGGITDAPNDGKPYVRKSLAWTAIDIIDAGTF